MGLNSFIAFSTAW